MDSIDTANMCILGLKIRLVIFIVDIWTFGSILRNGRESPNLLYKLIGIINLGKLWEYGLGLEIMKLAYYEIEWWSLIY